jgi:diguanylate cyclase (GGDEF)-like protein
MAANPPAPAPAWPVPRSIRAIGLVAAAGFGFLALHLGFGLGGARLDSFADRWVYDALEILAAGACLSRAVSKRGERVAWGVLGLGMLSFAVGDVCFDFLYGGSPPGVSICDAFYLGFYPACYTALALLIRSRVSTFGRALWLDGAIAGLAATSVSAAIVLQVVLSTTHGNETTMVVDLAYPVADLVLLAVVIMGFVLTGRTSIRAWATAGLAFAVIASADSLFMYLNATGQYAEGTLLDALWPAAMLLLAVAAWQPAATKGKAVDLEGRSLAAVPLLCGLLALGVLIAGRFYRHNVFADFLAVVAIVMVFVRTAVSFVDNNRLLERVRAQSMTDYLTGLGNRRNLTQALDRELRNAASAPMILAIFDLNGFKRYNDTFGHPAGDALLVRLANKLDLAVGPRGRAFRLGGDEFCVLARGGWETVETVVQLGTEALSETGEGFVVGTGYGAVVLPEETADPGTALRLADERLYIQKNAAAGSGEAVHAVLLEALNQRDPNLREHTDSVAGLARAVGESLGMTSAQLDELRLTAELHDIGNLAIPDSVLRKPGMLTESEWSIIRRHTVVGQRILAGAPMMSEIGKIVRATHERWDGLGYVDGLSSTSIPIGARIIAVCAAYTAMTSNRPYRPPMSPDEAIAELRRCAGTQFDPGVVEAFGRVHRQTPHPQSVPAPALLAAS